MAQIGVIQVPGAPDLGANNDDLERYLSELVALLHRRVIHVWNAATEVPEEPWDGLHGITTYGPTGGDGLYIYHNSAWHKGTLVVDGTFPS